MIDRKQNKTNNLESGQTWVLTVYVNCVMRSIFKPHFLHPKNENNAHYLAKLEFLGQRKHSLLLSFYQPF